MVFLARGLDPVAEPALACASIIWAAGLKTSSIGSWKTKTVGANPGSNSPQHRRSGAVSASLWRLARAAAPPLRLLSDGLRMRLLSPCRPRPAAVLKPGLTTTASA
jgi:hypothetical protein